MRRERARQATPQAEGGDYLSTVSDLVSALIFIFVILLAVFAYQLAGWGVAGEDTALAEVLQEIERRLDSAGVAVIIVPEQGVLRFSNNSINFDFGSEQPASIHDRNIGRLAWALAQVLPGRVNGHVEPTGSASVARPGYCEPPVDAIHYSSRDSVRWHVETLLIEGHTDSIPVSETGSQRYRDNLELSSMRAAWVHRMISDCESRLNGLRNSDGYPILSTSGYGEARPTGFGAAADRRIDLRFLLEPSTRLGDADPVTEEVGRQYDRRGER